MTATFRWLSAAIGLAFIFYTSYNAEWVEMFVGIIYAFTTGMWAWSAGFDSGWDTYRKALRK